MFAVILTCIIFDVGSAGVCIEAVEPVTCTSPERCVQTKTAADGWEFLTDAQLEG